MKDAELFDLIHQLVALSDDDLVDVLQAVFKEKRPPHVPDTQKKYFVGIASKDAAEYVEGLTQSDRWDIAAVGCPDLETYPEGFSRPTGGMLQIGWCPVCGTEVRHYARECLCPICNSIVRLG